MFAVLQLRKRAGDASVRLFLFCSPNLPALLSADLQTTRRALRLFLNLQQQATHLKVVRGYFSDTAVHRAHGCSSYHFTLHRFHQASPG